MPVDSTGKAQMFVSVGSSTVTYYWMETSMWSLPSVSQAGSFRTALSIVVCLTPQICLMHCWYCRAAGFSLETLHNGHAADSCCHRLTSTSVSQQLETSTQNNKAGLDMRFKTQWFLLSDIYFWAFGAYFSSVYPGWLLLTEVEGQGKILRRWSCFHCASLGSSNNGDW